MVDPIFEIPADTSLKNLTRERVDWVEGTACSAIPDQTALSNAVKPHRNAAVDAPDADDVLIAQFLHISDAQIRDEDLHDEATHARKLRDLDGFIRVAVRNSTVEQVDSLTLAAHLSAYAQESSNCRNDETHRFIVHTGDLLDTSVVSELITGIDVLKQVEVAHTCPIYSVTGNHDGLTFGNLTDAAAVTHGLGVNRSEFILGHLAMSGPRSNGFGFGQNEILQRVQQAVSEGIKPKAIVTCPDDQDRCDEGEKSWCGCVREQIKDVGQFISLADEINETVEALGGAAGVPDASDRVEEPSRCGQAHGACDDRRGGKADPLTAPAAFREMIHVSSFPDCYGVQFGYYSVAPAKGSRIPTRLLVLDTRHPTAPYGGVDLVQLGWLYNELRDAQTRGELVVLFAHHPPDQIEGDGGDIFRRMLDHAPHVAGYFHGHDHWNREKQYDGERFWIIQTGSLVDYPQAARDVKLTARRNDDGTINITVLSSFWRAQGNQTNSGLVLQGLLEASKRDSRAEHNQSLWSWWPPQWFARAGSSQAKVVERDGLWRDKYLDAAPLLSRLSPNTTMPNAAAIFGRSLRTVEDQRRELGVAPLGS